MNRQAGEAAEAPHPRMAHALFGHPDAETALLAAYRSRRMPHAVLLVGPRGIGKATLAYRLARFVLAHRDPAAPEVLAATSLAVDREHPTSRRIAAQGHSDLLSLERTRNEKSVLRKEIAVEDVRRTIPFFGATAGEGGWRIAIIDAVDELNRAGANALLKVLEEPPQRALLLITGHSIARVPPTLRSRCRIIVLRPLMEADVAAALAAASGRSSAEPQISAAAAAADGSVARAFTSLDDGALQLRQGTLDLLDRLPVLDADALHTLGDAIAGTDPQPLAAFTDTVNIWLARRLHGKLDQLGRLARLAEVWQEINAAARDADTYNLERKPLVFKVFGLLAEAVRG